VPTTRTRHFITESDQLAAALDGAALRWPELSRAQLLVRLALLGSDRDEERRARRRAALQAYSGSVKAAYPPGYLKELREEWPE
jgi:hypothetical protein